MAEDNQDQENEQEQASKPKKPMNPKVKLIIIVVIGLLVVVGSIFGTLVALGVFEGGDDMSVSEMPEQTASPDQAPQPTVRPAMYFPIKPAFVVNFPSRGKQRYLQVDITVMTRDPDIFTAMQTHMPLVKNRLVMMLSGQVYEELQTDEGKELLRQKAMQALDEVMQQELGKQGVEEILFTNFVMQ